MKASGGLPMFGGERDGGAAHAVVEPCVLGGGRRKEALEVQRGTNARNERARTVEESEEAVPVDGEEERVVRGEKSSARRERNGTVAEAGDGKRYDGLGVREFGNEDKLGRACQRKGVKQVGLEQRLKAAFSRHPDRLRLKETLECSGSGRVGKMVGQRADGGEQGLIDARAGTEAGVRGDFRPRLFRSLGEDFGVRWILASGVPCKRIGDADKWMQKDQGCFETRVVGLKQWDAVRRIFEFLRVHM